MRKNLPVNDHEYVLSTDDTIVSKTDIKGRITYVNRDFVRISGFSEEELIGQPHNIVRHPDMPPEAFADLWKTLKAGKAWTGVVKNRTKTGDYYWVEANAAPIREDGQVIGYTSVRTRASREQIQAAYRAYAEIRHGKTDLVVENGAAVRRNILHKFYAILDTSIMLRVYAAMSLMALLFLIIGIGAWKDTLNNGTLLTLTACGVLIASLSSFAIRRTLISPIEQAKAEIDRMAAGDLSAKIVANREDELSEVLQSLRVLQTNMKLLVGQIKEASHQVNMSSRGIAVGNLELSSRTESQAGALQETAESMEQLTGTVKTNAGNAQEASGLAMLATDIALKGGQVVSGVVSTMSTIKSSYGRIVDIIGVIDGIAFQTNLLALNAAVEAARAGSEGRGFATVAAEVRNLAQRAAGAAKEIKLLINDTASQVEAGSNQVNNAGQTMKEIVESIQRASLLMQEISTATVEQTVGIEHVNVAVAQMDKVTQQNAALVDEAAAAADNLQRMASNLVQLVESFRLIAQVNELADTAHP